MTITKTTEDNLAKPAPKSGLKELPKPAERKMRFFWQGNPEYGQDQLGDGDSTMSKGGCLASAMRAAAIYLGTRKPTEGPGQANKDYRKGKAFIGSDLVMHKAAEIDGLSCPQNTRLKMKEGATFEQLQALLEATLKDGDVAIVHVSTDWNLGNGGEHFILAYKAEGDNILTADSALATSVTLPRKTLEKKVSWNAKTKLYQVVSVAPVSVKAES